MKSRHELDRLDQDARLFPAFPNRGRMGFLPRLDETFRELPSRTRSTQF